jgi:dihydrofolate reductase
MRRVVVAEYVTLDGVMQDPGGVGEIEQGGWSNPYWNDELATFQYDTLVASDALLLGRVTYEGFAAAWPSMTEAGDFAVRMNGYPKYVVSTTLDKAEWNNSHIIKGNVPQEVVTLKQQPGRDILVYGSGQFVQMLIEHDLVDEFRLMVYPIVLGSGKRLFKDGTNTTLKLTGTHAFSSGVVALTYQPAGKEAR